MSPLAHIYIFDCSAAFALSVEKSVYTEQIFREKSSITPAINAVFPFVGESTEQVIKCYLSYDSSD